MGLLYQGWLFDERSLNRYGGAQAYPLIGMFPIQDNVTVMNDVRYAGIQELKWADQHIHREGNGFRLGSDQARFHIDLAQPVHSFYALAVDLASRRVDVSLICIVDAPVGVDHPIEEYLTEQGTPKTVEELKRFIAAMDCLDVLIGAIPDKVDPEADQRLSEQVAKRLQQEEDGKFWQHGQEEQFHSDHALALAIKSGGQAPAPPQAAPAHAPVRPCPQCEQPNDEGNAMCVYCEFPFYEKL